MLTLIVNPAAGSGYAAQEAENIRRELENRGVPYQMLFTQQPGHATALAAEAARIPGCAGVIALGGDGTAYEVACGMLDTGVPMGIIPVGTGNDFIKTIHTPKKPLEALDFILTHPARPVDVGQLNDRMFLNVCGTGFDVTVLECTLSAKKYCRGIFPYLIGLIKGIFKYRPVHVRYTVDGATQERDVLVCSIANGRYIGGGIPICLDARPDDGELDLVIVENRPRWVIPFYLPGLLMGKVLKFGVTTHRRCKNVEIVSPGMTLNVDGEIQHMDKATFSIQPGRLLMFW